MGMNHMGQGILGRQQFLQWGITVFLFLSASVFFCFLCDVQHTPCSVFTDIPTLGGYLISYYAQGEVVICTEEFRHCALPLEVTSVLSLVMDVEIYHAHVTPYLGEKRSDQ